MDYERFENKLSPLNHWYGKYLRENQAEPLAYEYELEVRKKRKYKRRKAPAQTRLRCNEVRTFYCLTNDYMFCACRIQPMPSHSIEGIWAKQVIMELEVNCSSITAIFFPEFKHIYNIAIGWKYCLLITMHRVTI